MSASSNRFNDIYHDFGDDNDENDDQYIDFDDPYQNINKEDEYNPSIIINQDGFDMKSSNQIIEEQKLSQKLTQLSTLTEQQQQEQDQPLIIATTTKRSPLTPTAVTTINKKIKMDNIEKQTENNDIPKYLSSDSQIFDRMIQPILEKTNHTIDMEHLRQIALLKHKIGFINLNIKLWTTYLHSGTGQLLDHITTTMTTTTNAPFLTIWPEDVKISMIENHETTATNPNNINNESCLDYVNKILNQYHDEKMTYKAQVEEKKIEYFNNNFTLDIEETMNKFIEEKGLTLHRLRIEGKIILVKYDYKDRLIELEFDQENPHQYQKEMFKKLIQAKYEKEKAIYEIATLKQRIAHHFLPKSFDLLQMPLPKSIYTINNEIIRQRLIDRSEKVLQRTKADMIQIYIEIEENKMNEYTTTFNTYMNQMKEDQISAPVHKKLNPTMIYIMNRRFKNIDERLLSQYKIKSHFFVQAPAIKKN